MNACSRLAVATVFAVLPLGAAADGMVTFKQGDVQAAIEPAAYAPVGSSQKIRDGETVRTGPGGAVSLRFDDGLVLALDENTTVKVVDYTYAAGQDRAAFEIERGAVRVVTGAMAERSAESLTVRGPHAELVSAGASDFTVVLVNPMYVKMNAGNVTAVNKAGKNPIAQGASVEIANSGAAPASISPTAMPPAANGPIGKLQVAAGTPGGPAAGAAAGAAGTGVGMATVLPLAVFGAAAAAAIGDDDDGSNRSSATHH